MSQPHQDLTRTTLSVLFIGGLIAASFWVLRPFLPAIIWALTLVIATWPLMQRVQRYAGNRRSLAVLIMTLALLLVLIVPFWLAISTILANVDEIADLARTVVSLRVPPPPDWLAEVPLVGTRATRAWGQLTSAGVRELAPRLTPYAGELAKWLASAVGSVGGMFVQFLLTVTIAAIMYAGGERAAAAAIRFGRRLGGDSGETAVRLAGQAIRSVALGVVVTAVAQSVLGGVGLGGVDSRDSRLGRSVIQSCLLGGGFGGNGSSGSERRGVGADRAVDHRPSRPEGLDRQGQPDVRRGRALDRAHGLALAGPARGVRRMEQRVPTLQPVEPQGRLVAHL